MMSVTFNPELHVRCEFCGSILVKADGNFLRLVPFDIESVPEKYICMQCVEEKFDYVIFEDYEYDENIV